MLYKRKTQRRSRRNMRRRSRKTRGKQRKARGKDTKNKNKKKGGMEKITNLFGGSEPEPELESPDELKDFPLLIKVEIFK